MKKLNQFLTPLLILMALAGLSSCAQDNSNIDPTSGDDSSLLSQIFSPISDLLNDDSSTSINYKPLSPADIFAINQSAIFTIHTIDVGGRPGSGSGFFINGDGLAVTNHHVMANVATAYISLSDGRRYSITGYVSYNDKSDIALIQVDNSSTGFPFVSLGDPTMMRTGDEVYAIGSPYGDPLTLTEGIISRIAYEPVNFDNYSIPGMFQTTAAVYEGNSGGPLLNNRGQVIAINAATRSDRPSVQFAVPVNRVVVPSDYTVTPLPIPPKTDNKLDENITFLDEYDFIPDFLSISENATLISSDTASSLSDGSIFYQVYDHIYVYALPRDVWVDETDRFDDALIIQGFKFQNHVRNEDGIWIYYYNEDRDISVSYFYMNLQEQLLIAIGGGDAYDILNQADNVIMNM